MADLQISQLHEETGTVLGTFPFAIVNTTAAETRKITTTNLATAIAANIGTGGLAASKVGAGYSGASLTDGTVTNAKLVSSSVNFGGVSVSLGAQDLTPSFNLQDATGYPASALTGSISNSQLAGSIDNSKLANSSVSFGGISVSLGNSDATPAFDLTDSTNYKTTNLVGSITNAQLAGSIENAKLSNSSVSFGGISLALGASDPHPAFDLQDSTGYKTTNLVGTITNGQLAGSIDASKLVANSLTSTQLGANCVGASELANNAVDTNSVQDGAIVNDKIETSSSSTTGIDGATKLRDGSVTASKLNASTVGNGLAINSNVLSINNTITGATSLGLTFSNQGICTGITAIQANDLSGVVATASAIGVVKVPSSGGLSVSGSGDLSLATTVTAFNTRGINVNAFGQVLSVSATVPSASLPVSSTTEVGGIKVPSTSSPLAVDGNGVLTIGLSGVTAGTGFTKFNVSDQGLVTSAGTIEASDIPNISAAVLTSGTIDAGRIGTNTISGVKLSDSSTTIFGGPGSTSQITTFPSAGDFKGQRFWDEFNSDEYIWTGSSWTPVTITAGELVFLGLYSASDNTVSSITTSGSAAGLTVNNALPNASSTNRRGYVVVDDTGTGSGNAPAVTLNAPDYLLSDGTAWQHVDVSSAIAATSAGNVSVSATGDDITNSVQTSLENLQTNKIRKTGGEMSGLLRITHTGSLAFEGSADDEFETFLGTVNPTSSDKTILLPNISGTLITTSDQNTVTSTMVDASLVNANIAANAAIALSKLAAVSAGQILVGAASTGTISAVTVSGDIALSSAGAFSYVAGSISNLDINDSAGIAASKIDQASVSQAGCVQLSSATTSTSATKAATPAAIKICKDAADAAQNTADAALPLSGGTLTGNLIVDNAKQIRFTETDAEGSYFVSLQAPDTLAADTSYTLPSSLPSANGQVLASTTGGVLSWTEDPAGGWVTSGDNISYSAGDVTFTGASYNLVWDKSANALEFADNAKAIFGTDSDLQLYHAGTNSIIANTEGDLYVKNTNNIFMQVNDTEAAVYARANGGVELYYDGGSTPKLETTSSGITVTGNILPDADSSRDLGSSSLQFNDAFFNGVFLKDSKKLFLGTDSDLQIYHDGNNAKIINKTGSLTLNATETEPGIDIKANGGVELYHPNTNSKKLETYSGGLYVTGNIVANQNNATLVLGSGNALTAYHDGNNSYISNTTGNLIIKDTTDAVYIQAPSIIFQDETTNENIAKFISDGAVELYWNGGTTPKLETTSTGVTVTGTVTDDKGNLRSIPANSQSSAHVATAADAGKAIYISTGGVTINNSVFSAGDAVTIINNSGSDQTITKGSGLTLYNSADATDANRTLAARGMATIWFASASIGYISGAGLS